MALVQLGGGVHDIRGSIGGTVFSRNRFGNYIRSRITPVNPNTGRQSDVRASVGGLASRWKNVLDQPQRDAWEVYAANISRTNKLGAQILLTGFNHFIRSNWMAAIIGAPQIDPGPVNLTLPAQDATMTATVDEAAQQISVAFNNALAWASQATGKMLIFMSLPHGVGRNFIGGPFRYAGQGVGEDPGPLASPFVVAAPFPVAETQVVKVGAVIREEDGRLTDRFFDQSSVTA